MRNISPGERSRLSIKIYNLFVPDAERRADNFMVADEMINQVASCLNHHDLYAGCVAGESSVALYRGQLYDYFHFLNNNLLSPTADSEPLEPRTVFVTGPVINVSRITGKSIIIELFKEGLLSLYCSNYRQPTHYRIGGYGQSRRTNTPRNIVNEDIYIEEAHPPLEDMAERPKHSRIASYNKEPEYVDGIIKKLDDLLASSDVVKIEKEGEYLDKFIFLTKEQIQRLKNFVFHNQGPEAFSSKARDFNYQFIIDALKQLNIRPCKYPD